MRKGLLKWVVSRFGLTRLVIALVFLGLFAGLNVYGPEEHLTRLTFRYHGWPLPIVIIGEPRSTLSDERDEDWPWTHETYDLILRPPVAWLFDSDLSDREAFQFEIAIGGLIIDILFALTVFGLILFFPSRRNAALLLRSWFAWRFGPTRLVVAVLFLGAFMGLNMRTIGPMTITTTHPPYPMPMYVNCCCWGWPFPVVFASPPVELKVESIDLLYSYHLPWTHRTYSLLEPFDWIDCPSQGILVCAIIDALFALTILAVILFFQIPRRQTPAPPPHARAGG